MAENGLQTDSKLERRLKALEDWLWGVEKRLAAINLWGDAPNLPRLGGRNFEVSERQIATWPVGYAPPDAGGTKYARFVGGNLQIKGGAFDISTNENGARFQMTGDWLRAWNSGGVLVGELSATDGSLWWNKGGFGGTRGVPRIVLNEDGTVTAGGWSIETEALSSAGGKVYLDAQGRVRVGTTVNQRVWLDGVDSRWRLYAGSDTPNDAPFRVDSDGNMVATAGQIGGWKIGEAKLLSTALNLELNSAYGHIYAYQGNAVTILKYDGLEVYEPSGDQGSPATRILLYKSDKPERATIDFVDGPYLNPLQPRLRLKFQGTQGQPYASIVNLMENYIYTYADRLEWYSNRDYAADQMRAWWTSGEKVFWWAAKGESGVVPRFELHNGSAAYPRVDFVVRQSGTGQKYWSIQFQPNQSESTAQLIFRNELAGANVLALYGQGVGIGTATPTFPLVVFREGYSDLLLDSVSDSGVPRLFGRRARGTLENKSYVLADNQLLSIGALGYYGGSTPGYTSVAKAVIRAHAAEDWVGPSNTGAYLSFLVTKRGGNTTVERFRITDEGTIRITPLSAAPSSPANGDIAYADGTNWNPGSGAGFYGYQGGTWVKL